MDKKSRKMHIVHTVLGIIFIALILASAILLPLHDVNGRII